MVTWQQQQWLDQAKWSHVKWVKYGWPSHFILYDCLMAAMTDKERREL